MTRFTAADPETDPGSLANPDGGRLVDGVDRHTVEGWLGRVEGDKIRCVACGHRCLLASGRRGLCKVRFNHAGRLQVPFGYVAGVACDPVEKKPFFHVLPGSDALTFGMLGCDFHCAYCQNWFSSQVLRDTAAGARARAITPGELVATARRVGARLVVSSYNEPLITAEWAAAVFDQARPLGLLGAFVSNGHATPEVIEFLAPRLAAFKVDLKTFRDAGYRALGGRLTPVLETIRLLSARGLWLEVVTLLVPGFNDDPGEWRDIAEFLASVSPDIPWHVTAFRPEYQMTGSRPTAVADLVRAVEIGVAAGLRFVYAGNLPGQVGDGENTRCPGCGEILVVRRGFRILRNRIKPDGGCPRCRQLIPGIWGTPPILVPAVVKESKTTLRPPPNPVPGAAAIPARKHASE